MNVATEIVRAEMDYRVERARSGIALEHVREARRLHRSWYRRLFEHSGRLDRPDEVPTGVNGAALAA